MRTRKTTLCTFLFLFFLPAPPAVLSAGSAEPPSEIPAFSTAGSLIVQGEDRTLTAMPLKHTRVTTEITAFIARTTVEQVFENRFDVPIEAIYTFPLGDTAAVDRFEMIAGERVIEVIVMEKEEARETYEKGVREGHQAALLEQNRPNIFTQSVANIEPAKEITVRIRTVETLECTAGVYEYLFPLVVGPRSTGDAGPYPGGVPAWNVPRTERPEHTGRTGNDVEIRVRLDAGIPIHALSSPSHRIRVEQPAAGLARVSLAEDDRLPNKDFILRWNVASEKPAVGLLAHRTDLEGFFTLLLQPKEEVAIEEAAPKEIIMVLDTSGSMYGVPLERSQAFMRSALKTLGPRDTFNMVQFAGTASIFAPGSRENRRENIQAGLRWVSRLKGKGNTDLMLGLQKALRQPADPDRLRMIVVLTDGYIGDDDRILAEISRIPDSTRIFTLGIGSAVNHSLLRRMAEIGGGSYTSIPEDADTNRAVERFTSWITRPYLTDLTIDWGALQVTEITPDAPKDLFSGQSMGIIGKYFAGGEDDIVLRGKLGGRYWETAYHVALPERETAHGSLASVWARWRIDELLEEQLAAKKQDASREQVLELALRYNLMSPYTSFVAVDYDRVVNPEDTPMPVVQELLFPEGVGTGRELTETVRVLAQRNPIDLESSQVSTVFHDAFIQDLPVPGRYYQNVLALAPSVQDAGGDGWPNVHGSRSRDFKVMVSGISGVDPLTGSTLPSINPNSIEEMEAITAGAGVEFGRAQGGFANIVQKQGSNQVDGTVELEGSPGSGNDPDVRGKRAAWGISGPVVPDRLWYRVSGSIASYDLERDLFHQVGTVRSDSTVADGRLTWQASPRNKLSLQFGVGSKESTGAGLSSLTLPGTSVREKNRSRSLALDWTIPVSPRLVILNTVRFDHSRLEQGPAAPTAVHRCGNLPSSVSSPGQCFDLASGMISGASPRFRNGSLRRLVFKTSANLYAGLFLGVRHSLSFGFETGDTALSRQVRRNPELYLSGDTLLERFSSQDAVSGTGQGAYRSLFLEDKTDLLQNLELVFGGRLDQDIASAPGTTYSLLPSDGSIQATQGGLRLQDSRFSPYLSLAWDPSGSGKTKLQAVLRTYHDRFTPWLPLAASEPASYDRLYRNQGGGWSPAVPSDPAPNVLSVQPGLRLPGITELTIQAEREVAAETVLAASWSARDYRGQFQFNNLNSLNDGSIVDPRWGDVFVIGNQGTGSSRTWEISLVRRQYRSWEFKTRYSHTDATDTADPIDPASGDPATLYPNRPGPVSGVPRNAFHLAGTSITPWGFRFGWLVDWNSGLPWSPLRWSTVFGHPRFQYEDRVRNSRWNQASWTVDLKIAKEMNTGKGGNLTISLEIHNLLDETPYLVRNGRTGTGRSINGFQEAYRRTGRNYELGLRFTF